jgi:hypothetical protein
MDDGMLFLIIAIISITIGYLAGSLMSNARKRQEEIQSEEPTEPPPPQFPPDALHIWRDQTNGQLVIQIGERAFQSSAPLPPTEHKYISQLLLILQKWLGVEKKAPPPFTPPAQPVSQHPSTPQVSQSSTGTGPLDPSDAPEAPKSIVAQVDEILQDLLATSPLRDRGIRLMENLDGSMRFYIGLDSYDDVDSIPDEEIKGIIRTAVRTWETRQ